ncbi:MAG: fluoride efflux transporter CrcB [Ruminococcus sp.]|nr:fluoride efflux transporter CrcB [Ruminococcus sp.]MBQ4261962.1 fluoride efflux transporter CrcB [Ruminococcus sp.]SCX10184.1 CrcB protein [Ruminococcaceae bacterium P7]
MGFFFVALGGALGAAGRYALSLIPVRTEFPSITLMTNILGAMAIGFIAGLLGTRDDLSPNVALFWKTGVCGGFTTFSTFSLEAWQLLEKGNYLLSALYALLSVVCCVAGVWIGRKLSGLITI